MLGNQVDGRLLPLPKIHTTVFEHRILVASRFAKMPTPSLDTTPTLDVVPVHDLRMQILSKNTWEITRLILLSSGQ